MKRTLLIVFAAASCLFGSCASTLPEQSAEVLRTTMEMEVRSKGKMNLLVAQAHAATDHVASIPPGTPLRLAGHRQINTITHGSQSWQEAVFLDGPMRGQRVTLGFADVARFLR